MPTLYPLLFLQQMSTLTADIACRGGRGAYFEFCRCYHVGKWKEQGRRKGGDCRQEASSTISVHVVMWPGCRQPYHWCYSGWDGVRDECMFTAVPVKFTFPSFSMVCTALCFRRRRSSFYSLFQKGCLFLFSCFIYTKELTFTLWFGPTRSFSMWK